MVVNRGEAGITERNERLPDDNEQLDFFDTACVPLHWVAPDGTILRANQAELDLLGYRWEEYVGRQISEFHVDPHRADGMLECLGRGETLENYPCRMRAKDGSIREVLVNSNGLWRNGEMVHTRCITLDITELKHVESALRASEERYRALVEGHAEMVCRFRPDGTILFVNTAYARARDTTAEALLNANFWDFVPEEDRPAVQAMLDSLTPEAPESRVENRFETVTGERWIHWTNRALSFAPDGRLLEAQSTGIDITDRKQMEQALKESDRRKDEFLATLAHELRNPLAPISNSLQILKRSGDNREQRQVAHAAIDRQLNYLVRLVDDLLDVSRITRDKLELRPSRVELGPVVRQAIDTCRPMADDGQQELRVSLPEEPVFLDADPVRLAQVLNNLLNNACKYTPAGGWIEVAVERRQDEVIMAVRDSGIGMPPDQLEQVFEMFAQVHGSDDGVTGGLGIGLTLVKRLVELHRGSIEARSEGRGKGSEFIVRLPASAEPAPAARPRRSDREAATPRRILVVDDNRDSAESLGMLLELQGHETRVAYDGLAAVTEAERFDPEVVLLDLGLPKLNGIDACRRIRAQPWGRKMMIVALTGWGQEKDRRRSKDAGFDRHLVKPVEAQVLSSLLEKADV